MKIHMRPPIPFLPPAPPPKSAPTAFQLAMQGEELIKTAQQQRTRLKKLYGAWKNPGDLDEDEAPDSENCKRNHRSNRKLDFLT